jgi:hypothetical protein
MHIHAIAKHARAIHSAAGRRVAEKVTISRSPASSAGAAIILDLSEDATSASTQTTAKPNDNLPNLAASINMPSQSEATRKTNERTNSL